eukprot:1177310-Prorocentrum_minimum.AAC.1
MGFRCDIWEVDETPEVLIHGHPSTVKGLAMNPSATGGAQFATACDSGRVCLWNSRARRLTRSVAMGGPAGTGACSLAYSPDAKHLAVGMADGGVNVVDAGTLQFYKALKTFETASPVSDVRYSPDGRVLAAASNLFIDLYDARRNYTKLGRCVGHAATVAHLDWAEDSRVLFSNCNNYEMLYWDAKNGKQVSRLTPS